MYITQHHTLPYRHLFPLVRARSLRIGMEHVLSHLPWERRAADSRLSQGLPSVSDSGSCWETGSRQRQAGHTWVACLLVWGSTSRWQQLQNMTCTWVCHDKVDYTYTRQLDNGSNTTTNREYYQLAQSLREQLVSYQLFMFYLSTTFHRFCLSTLFYKLSECQMPLPLFIYNMYAKLNWNCYLPCRPAWTNKKWQWNKQQFYL